MIDRAIPPISEYSVVNLTRGLTLATRIRLAWTSAQRRRGLLGTTTLESGAGIWINPCEAIHTFGMRMALDAVFLDSKLRVKKIAEYLKPSRIAFCITATSVLELKAGTSAASSTRPGDQLLFSSLKSAQEDAVSADKTT